MTRGHCSCCNDGGGRIRKELFFDLGSKLVPRVREGGMFHPTTIIIVLLTVSATKTFLTDPLDITEPETFLASLSAIEAEYARKRCCAIRGGG